MNRYKIMLVDDEPSRALSDEQKNYWSGMADKVDTPLQYGYHGGWENIISSFELLMFALLAICIEIAPVFSGEYQAGTDAVILSAKYGKTKLTTAKIVASLLFGTAAFILHVVVACGLPLAMFGIDGWNLPLQIANTTIPYPYTFLQAALPDTVADHEFQHRRQVFRGMESIFLHRQGVGRRQRFSLDLWESGLYLYWDPGSGGIAWNHWAARTVIPYCL